MLISGISNAEVDTRVVVFDEWPPYSYTDQGQVKGTDVELLKMVGKKLNINFEFRSFPWSRSLKMAQVGKADAIISLYRNEERKKFLEYPNSPISVEEIVLVASANSKLKPITKLDDLIGYKIGVTKNTSYGVAFDSRKDLNLLYADNTDQKLIMLENARMDLVLVNRAVLSHLMLNKPELHAKFRILDFVVNKEDLFIGFSKLALQKNKLDLIGLARAISEVQKSAEYKKIQKNYFGF